MFYAFHKKMAPPVRYLALQDYLNALSSGILEVTIFVSLSSVKWLTLLANSQLQQGSNPVGTRVRHAVLGSIYGVEL